MTPEGFTLCVTKINEDCNGDDVYRDQELFGTMCLVLEILGYGEGVGIIKASME